MQTELARSVGVGVENIHKLSSRVRIQNCRIHFLVPFHSNTNYFSFFHSFNWVGVWCPRFDQGFFFIGHDPDLSAPISNISSGVI